MKELIVATRESPLALKQANIIKEALQAHHADLNITLLGMTTKGDRELSGSLAKTGGKGLFVKELEQALLEKRADIAVHSMKDLPAEQPAGLCVPIVCEREDPRDVLVASTAVSFDALPTGARVGTSSLRRECQLRHLRADLNTDILRGNVNTRLSKLDNGEFDAIILAAAGLHRLGFASRITEYLLPEQSVPAVGQGALGIECRRDDEEVLSLIKPLLHMPTYTCVQAERAMNAKLGGNCTVPVAGFASWEDGKLLLRGRVGMPDGSVLLHSEAQGLPENAIQLGEQVAEDLFKQGAADILARIE